MKSLICGLAVAMVTIGAPFARSEEADIVEISQRNPLKMFTPSGPVQYGDLNLKDAIDGLGDLPRPWTVPKIIDLFDTMRGQWMIKMKALQDANADKMWNGWEEEARRMERMATLLAVSRDPRAALCLERLFDSPYFIGRANVKAEIGFVSYFLSDPRYRPIPKEKGAESPEFEVNSLSVDYEKRIKAWRKLNDVALPAMAEEQARKGTAAK